MSSSLLPFSDSAKALSPHSASVIIRDAITRTLDDPKVWAAITPELLGTGIGGGPAYSRTMVALAVMQESVRLKDFPDLTVQRVARYVTQILRKREYVIQGGYIVGHPLDDKSIGDSLESDESDESDES